MHFNHIQARQFFFFFLIEHCFFWAVCVTACLIFLAWPCSLMGGTKPSVGNLTTSSGWGSLQPKSEGQQTWGNCLGIGRGRGWYGACEKEEGREGGGGEAVGIWWVGKGESVSLPKHASRRSPCVRPVGHLQGPWYPPRSCHPTFLRKKLQR